MADFDNLSEINENFDTIKTLLNSIRAQGILNTSDVDKLLSGINHKLEKINTEEDIDLIKIFLSELKQNLDERHSVLISKFGAIESLFSNLLKNSSEMPKSSELKELFDIVATNLSVFSREVVSQKEALTDITLRLDALRSDDSQKKDIIKNITLLKPDLERLNNGFDSIVLSLNDNFKTIIKTITTLDKTDYLEKFSNVLSGIEMSSNTVLSALQMLDKKTEQVEDSLKELATKEDVALANQKLFELAAQGNELSASVTDLSDRYYRIDSLSEKIDASVNIIASLKSVLEDADNSNTKTILDRLSDLDSEVRVITSDTKFDDFKLSLENILQNISESTLELDKNFKISAEEVQRIMSVIKSLDINVSFKNLLSALSNVETELKSHIDNSSQKLMTLQDANITRVLNDISTSADALGAKLNQTQAALAVLCEKNFGSVFENIADLKSVVAQIDENSISANNAIFSSITDRLTVFENSLRASLESQEKTVSDSSARLVEQVENIKNLSGVLDYKMDSSVVEIGNVKREFSSLKSAVDDVLALDFVNTVKDLRVDLYASKQELMNTVESANNELSEKFTNDLYGKYELLISKLDNVEDEFKKTQTSSLAGIKSVLENISASIVDVLSYVSESKSTSDDSFDYKLAEISKTVSENSLNYIEGVRDVVDVIRVQIENNLNTLSEVNASNFEYIKESISSNTEDLKKDIKFSYSKLLELQDSYKELREMLNLNSITASDKFEGIMASADNVKADFETKLASLKSALLDKISEFKQEFTCENADKVSELKFAVENLYNKNTQDIAELISDLRSSIDKFTSEDSNTKAATLAKILDNFVALKEYMNALNNKYADVLAEKVDVILQDFSNVKTVLEKVDENVDGDMTRQLSIIESNFESLVSQITILFDKSDKSLADRINEEFDKVSEKMQASVSEKLEAYKLKIEETFDKLEAKAGNQSEYLKERISDLNTAMKSVWEEQSENNVKQVGEIADKLKEVIDNNIKLTAVDYEELKNRLSAFAHDVENNNQVLTQDLKAQLDDITKYIDSVLDIQAQDILLKHDELSKSCVDLSVKYDNLSEQMRSSTQEIGSLIAEKAQQASSEFGNLSEQIKASDDKLTSIIIEKTRQASHENVNLSEQLSRSEEKISNNAAEIGKSVINKTEEISSQLSKTSDRISEDMESGFEAVGAAIEASVTKMLNSYETDSSNVLRTMAELGAAASENLEKAKTETINILGEIKTELEAQQTDLKNSKIETIKSIKDVKSVADEQLNFSRISHSDTLQAIDEVKSLTEEQLALAKSSTENLASLTNICINNKAVADEYESFAKDRHETALMKAENIYNTVKNIENTAGETSSVVAANKNGIAELANIVSANRALLNNLESSLSETTVSLRALTAEISAGELQTLDAYVNHILEQIEAEKQNVKVCKDLIVEFTKKELDIISQNVEKETDIIIGELIEQFDLLKKSQADELISQTSNIEEIISSHIYNNIEDLKSYLDIKTDSSILTNKLDNLKADMTSSVEDIINNLNRLLDTGVFTSAMSDYRLANEVIINTSIDRLNERIEAFVGDNINSIAEVMNNNNKDIESKLTLFDKKFIDTLVDKYEEIKLISNKCNDSFSAIQGSLFDILNRFELVKESLNGRIDSLIETVKNTNDSTNQELRQLNECFENLRSQISNKSFDEAFQASINKQISALESLINEQIGYVEDISELCVNNLPDVAELNMLVKHSVLTSIQDFSDKLEAQDIEGTIERGIKEFKADIITQFLNIFNQISFVTEQEEILDFIHDKHEELISVLSHIVTTTSEIENVKENVSVVDNKIDSLKDEIELINGKISSIISAEGDVDYVYSLQDLESDIANLRLALNEMKENDHGQDFNDLITSTNDIYKLVEAIKTELPQRRDFEGIAEDIVSISTRTNKLILASDESYKTLQDNLHDFKLVINDLDERTRNFAQESGIERMNSKLNALNSMMENGAKTNQVFNQVFEYLAEWVDNASVQINTISDKVETLDDIGQIKDMLADLKAGAEDNSETVELIEALGTVFDKQTKRISSLEAKLDKIIVETTINSRNNKIDLGPMEDTLNRFLVAIDEKMTYQQDKIKSLETKLEDLFDGKETAQLTKKVGGMDRQIAKLNKSIEKIASHVVEK